MTVGLHSIRGAVAGRLLVALTGLLGSAVANSDAGWSYRVTPYLWGSSLKGKVATLPGAEAAEVDVSFSDILENLDLGFMAAFEARKDRLGLIGEVLYMGISADADTPGALFSKADYEQDLWSVNVGGSYALVQTDKYVLDAMLGVTFWDLDNTLKLKAGLLPTQKIDEHETWQDPFVGLRGRMELGKNWFFMGRGLTAVGGDSDSAWDVFGAIGYDFGATSSLAVGYRHMEVDYENGSFLFDVEMSGPVVGLLIRF